MFKKAWLVRKCSRNCRKVLNKNCKNFENIKLCLKKILKDFQVCCHESLDTLWVKFGKNFYEIFENWK